MGYLRQVRPPPPVVRSAVSRHMKGSSTTFRDSATARRKLTRDRRSRTEISSCCTGNRPTLELDRPLRPYLFAVAFRVVCAHRRRRAREIPFAQLDTEDQTLSPEGTLQSRESVRLLMVALDTIALPRRAVVIMHDLDGISIVDIAEKLSISRFGAYARLRKARKELASALRRLLRAGVRR